MSRSLRTRDLVSDRDGMLVLGEDLQDRPGDAEVPLDRLVGVGVRAESDRLADVALLRELLPKSSATFGFENIRVSKSRPEARNRGRRCVGRRNSRCSLPYRGGIDGNVEGNVR
jgi:hypothetical protein